MSETDQATQTRRSAPTKRARATQVTSPTYVARRPLKVGTETRQPGDEVPEAVNWPRVDAWIRSGHLDLVLGERR